MKSLNEIKVSIITVTKNSEAFLAETIKSVIDQTYPLIEYIIIDGASTDNTLNIVKQFSFGISNFLSEKDQGMYDAINKGLKLATGDYILILNSDDVLAAATTIEQMVKQINLERLDYYYGNMIKSKDNMFKKVKLFPVTFKQLLLSGHGTFVPHPCFLISKNQSERLDEYDTKYKYAADFDYILRTLAADKCKGKYIDLFITKFRIHNNSITASGKINEERKKILQKHGYNRYSLLTRLYFYYSLWIYYKIVNIGNKYKSSKT
jgi:glycosyltransferase involved in cell wall biosynthesis